MHPQANANRSGQALGGDTNWSDRFVMTHSKYSRFFSIRIHSLPLHPLHVV